MQDWSCQICNQHRAPSPLAELVSNPTPPGQITHEQAASVILSRHREWDFQIRPCFIFLEWKFENSCNLANKMGIDGGRL
jgi:hypothetical protein